MKRIFSIIWICIIPGIAGYSQYISEVLEYIPAPSQYMNAAPWGIPTAASSIIGGLNGNLSLGAFGGYVVFRFERAVENDPENPYGIDFTIFGNPAPNWSEPGIVSVMKDENGNGMADDTWYVLAGSDHYFSTSEKQYSVSYQNPGTDSAANIPWIDSHGSTGEIKANSFYRQSYYPMADSFPQIDQESYTLSGAKIHSTVDTSSPASIFSLKRTFGYVDNQFRGNVPYTVPDNPYTSVIENSGGDAFDISWAMDESGKYVDLDSIHFIKVHTAVLEDAGWLGQITTEITGAVDVGPDPSVSGPEMCIVIKELPPVIDQEPLQLEVFVFTNGRLTDGELVNWEINLEGTTIDEKNILYPVSSGELVLRCSLDSDPNVKATVSATVKLTGIPTTDAKQDFLVYPNPAHDRIRLKYQESGILEILSMTGEVLVRREVGVDESIPLNNLLPATYILRFTTENEVYVAKLLKR